VHPWTRRVWEHVTAALPGWLLVSGGLALIALAVLTPAWLSARELGWRQEVLAAQAAALIDQQDRYQRFALALEHDDPVVLERLAYVELGLKPVHKTPLPPVPYRVAGDYRFTSHAPGQGSGGGGRELFSPIAAAGSVDDWLARPLPKVGRELRAYERPNTRLTRLATGRSRFVMLAAGAICLVAGLWPGMWGNGGRGESAAGAAASPHR